LESRHLQKIRTCALVSSAVLLLGGCSSSSDKTGTDATAPSTSTNTGSNDTITAGIPRIKQGTRLDTVPDTAIVCTVGTVPITMKQFRQQFRAQQQSVEASLSMDPSAQTYLLNYAKIKNITLTPEEKKKLVDTAKTAQGKNGSTSFSDYLKKNNMTQKDFENQILDMGLADKAANAMIEESLIEELVNRELLSQSAIDNNFMKIALAKFDEMKATPDYAHLRSATGFSDEELKDEIVKNQLSQSMIEKIQNDSPIKDEEVRKFYDDHQDKLKHGDRLRMSQIVLAASKDGVLGRPGIKAMIEKQQPTLKGADLDKEAAKIIEEKRKKAEDLLAKAKGGADFATLANENTEDVPIKAAKSGGDTGWQEKAALTKELVTAVDSIKVGELYPKVLTSPYGFHIVKLTGKQGPGIIPFDEVKDRLKELMKKKHDDDIVKKWLADRRKIVKVTTSEEFNKALKSAPSVLVTPGTDKPGTDKKAKPKK
jgi:parvulin-like peptidyl-prolyl isomerase